MRKRKEIELERAAVARLVELTGTRNPSGKLSIPVWQAVRMVSEHEVLRAELTEKIANPILPWNIRERKVAQAALDECRVMLRNLNTFMDGIKRVTDNMIIEIHDLDLFADPNEYAQRVKGIRDADKT